MSWGAYGRGRRILAAGFLGAVVSASVQLVGTTPAKAIDEIVIFADESISIEIAARLSWWKRNNTLGAGIVNTGSVHSLSRTITNFNIVPISIRLRQITWHHQATWQDNDIVILNSGFIDPAIGIDAQIVNQTNVRFFNEATDQNINSFGLSGSLDQRLTHYQRHLLSNTVVIDNSGDIVAGQAGILAGVTNRNFLQVLNSTENRNEDTGGTTFNLTQTLYLRQHSRISNLIHLTNSGDIAAGTNGIQTEIENLNIADVSNTASAQNESSSPRILRNLYQSLDRANRTAIDSTIAIGNTGNIQAGRVGIGAEINIENLPALSNTSVDRNDNIVSPGRDARQRLVIDQDHALGNAILIDNAGEIESGSVAIAAQILNEDISRIENTNDSIHINGNSDNVGGALSQSLHYDQANLLENTASISNTGRLKSGDGIGVEIENSSFSAVINNTDQINDNSGDTAGNLSQTSSVNQSNRIANTVFVDNTADIEASRDGIAVDVENASIALANFADITSANSGGLVGGNLTQSIALTQTNAIETNVLIVNEGKIDAGEIGIAAEIDNDGLTLSNQANLDLSNSASVSGSASQSIDVTQINRVESGIIIANSGDVSGRIQGVHVSIEEPSLATSNTAMTTTSLSGASLTMSARNIVESSIFIENTGSITADSLFAIEAEGAATTVYNHSGGTIAGFVELSDTNDRFENGPGGTFYALRTSDFGAGNDGFVNRQGALLQAAREAANGEETSLVNLERFTNQGELSVIDAGTGDTLTLSGDPGRGGIVYSGSGKAKLGMDVFLRGNGSSRDRVIVEGDVLGRTTVVVNNTNLNSGIYNPDGIPIIFATGQTPDALAFNMPQPVDAGFFDYDLFFVPTGSGYWELKSFPGGGARMLPQLMTAAQDTFHITNETWFDRSADLRVLLHRQNSLVQAGRAGISAAEQVPDQSFVPAIWVKGGGSWLQQDDRDTARAYGRTYSYNLNRDLDVANFQTGIDMGTENVLTADDMLVFGLLGGVSLGQLEYDVILREFDLKGGEFGAYATYLKGNLFIDTLVKGQYLSYDANGARGFPDSFDSISWGGRTDAGYRFGGYSSGLFLEPLATIAVAWTDLENISNGGNHVTFKDNESIRGRLGLRIGATYEVWGSTVIEPFVIGSYWKDFTDSNQTTLVSAGQTFDFYDAVADGWGEASTGFNLFNPNAKTAVFAKTDFIFGDGVEGVAGRAGMRVNW
ncbi:MAG: autotransporter outer membrane beta-barrel domain-containing protein [Methyloligella sp. ZOD6]